MSITPLTELTDWIQADVIAQSILEELEEQAIAPTLENGQKVWLDALEELHHLIAASIGELIARGELQ